MQTEVSAVGFPRVISETIKPFSYRANCSPASEGEVVEVRAAGVWQDQDGERYPLSLHITVPPGCSFIPVTGDNLRVRVSCATSEEMKQESMSWIESIGATVQSLSAAPRDPKIIFYGPHACQKCGALICRMGREFGTEEYTYPEGPIYPNTEWVPHVCQQRNIDHVNALRSSGWRAPGEKPGDDAPESPPSSVD